MKRIIFILGTVSLIFFKILWSGTVPKYISLAPSTTEILFALGLDEEIAAVSSYCNYPPEAKTKESIGEFSRPNIEKILSLKPDYIFCTGLEQQPAIAELKRQNLKVYVADPKNMRELFQTIRDIATLTAKKEEGEKVIKGMQGLIQEIASKIKTVPPNRKPKVFLEIWNEPLMTAGAGSFIDELLVLAGGRNIASDTKRAYTIFSQEEVIKRNPDCVIFAYMGIEKPQKLLENRPGWSAISAVKNNRLYNDINPDILLRPGPRVAQGVEEIYKRLYRGRGAPVKNEKKL